MHGRTIELISLDAGGVLVVPHQGYLLRALRRAGVEPEVGALGEAHYHAMGAVDRARSRPEDFTDYLAGLLDVLDVDDPAVRERARVELETIFHSAIWCQPVPGARRALEVLASSGIRMAVTSNSDGSVEHQLRVFEVVQVGPGAGVEIEVVVDSGQTGVAKPDPAIFELTSQHTGVPIERILHVGDSLHYDVHGANAAGALGVHFDPYGLAPHGDHLRVASLVELLELISAGTD